VGAVLDPPRSNTVTRLALPCQPALARDIGNVGVLR